MEIVILLVLIFIAIIGCLIIRRLGTLICKLDTLKFNVKELEDVKLTMKSKDDLINELSIREATKKYVIYRDIIVTHIEEASKLLVDIVAAGVSKGLSGKGNQNTPY